MGDDMLNVYIRYLALCKYGTRHTATSPAVFSFPLFYFNLFFALRLFFFAFFFFIHYLVCMYSLLFLFRLFSQETEAEVGDDVLNVYIM